MTPAQLKDIRKRNGLTLTAMAELLGMKSERSIRRWEAGTHPIPLSIQKLITEMLNNNRNKMFHVKQ